MHGGHEGAPEVDKVKCPNCGFVTFPDPAECKKCGHRFAPDGRRPQQTARSVTFRSPDRPFALSSPESAAPRPVPERAPITPKAQVFTPDADVAPAVAIDTAAGFRPSQPGPGQAHGPDSRSTAAETANPWHEEIAARVARYRRRRGLQEESHGDKSNFEFEFEHPPHQDQAVDAPTAAEMELSRDRRDDALELDLDSDENSEAPRLDAQSGSGPREDPAEWVLEPLDFRASERPVEIVLSSGQHEEDEEQNLDVAPKAAPLGRRFAAGMLDVLVLLVAGVVFFALFRASGGRLDRQPADLAIIGFAGAFLLIFYFSAFTALAFATPGQSAVGLRVRTFDGETPNVSASLWRGAGYLVSSILMLGFAWAALDPERLTWHDHMSGTCLVEHR